MSSSTTVFPSGIETPILEGLEKLSLSRNLSISTNQTPIFLPFQESLGGFTGLIDKGFSLNGIYLVRCVLGNNVSSVVFSASGSILNPINSNATNNTINILSVTNSNPNSLEFIKIDLKSSADNTVGLVAVFSSTVNSAASLEVVGFSEKPIEPQENTSQYIDRPKQVYTGYKNIITITKVEESDGLNLNLITRSNISLAFNGIGSPTSQAIQQNGNCITLQVDGSDISSQIFISENGQRAFFRTKSGESSSPWQEILRKSEFDTYSELTESLRNADLAQNTLEHNNILQLITASIEYTDNLIQQATTFSLSLIQEHEEKVDPHSQYLKAGTFGVSLPMSASLSTPRGDQNRVFGWNGESGDSNFPGRSIRWWNSHTEEIYFKPFRSYGLFLLWCDFQPQGRGILTIRRYDKNDNMLDDIRLADINRAGYNQWEPPVQHVFDLPEDGYVRVWYTMNVWNKHYGAFNGGIYVDDRVKRFTPVGYTTVVDGINSSQNNSSGSTTDFTAFPAFEWMRFDEVVNGYVELFGASVAAPSDVTPHIHRVVFPSILDTELWVFIEIGEVEVATSNYTQLAGDVLRAITDENGITIVRVPLSMRARTSSAGSVLRLRVAFSTTEIPVESETYSGSSIDGDHFFYIANEE